MGKGENADIYEEHKFSCTKGFPVLEEVYKFPGVVFSV